MAPKKNGKRAPQAAKPPIATGSVITPKTPQKPTGYQWDMLKKAKTQAEVKKIQEWAKINGFSPTGQFMKAIDARLEE